MQETNSMTMLILLLGALGTIGIAVGIGLSRRASQRSRVGRLGGIAGFASSMHRDPNDQVVRAVYEALIKVGGPGFGTVEGGDDLGSRYGLVGEDIDDLVLDAANRVDGVGSQALIGVFVDLKTPSEVVELLEKLRRGARVP